MLHLVDKAQTSGYSKSTSQSFVFNESLELDGPQFLQPRTSYFVSLCIYFLIWEME